MTKGMQLMQLSIDVLGIYYILMVRSRRLELPRGFPHSDLNAARLPIPPRPHEQGQLSKRGATYQIVYAEPLPNKNTGVSFG